MQIQVKSKLANIWFLKTQPSLTRSARDSALIGVRNMVGDGLVAEKSVSEVSLIRDECADLGEIRVGQDFVFF